jgi:hypothetical protein
MNHQSIGTYSWQIMAAISKMIETHSEVMSLMLPAPDNNYLAQANKTNSMALVC